MFEDNPLLSGNMSLHHQRNVRVANAGASNLPQGNTQTNLPEDIAIMEIILRFLQLLCENHNSELQNYLRVQPTNKTSYNLVCETLQFLDCICGSTTGGLGLLGLWINENNVHLINQALETLTEYCQGPCHDNQYAIINHESNGIDIVIALILNDIQPLSKNNLEMFLALKDNASKLLLAVMESNDDTANAERILYNITPKALIDVIREAYEQGKEMDRQAELAKNRDNQSRTSSTSSFSKSELEHKEDAQSTSNNNTTLDTSSNTNGADNANYGGENSSGTTNLTSAGGSDNEMGSTNVAGNSNNENIRTSEATTSEAANAPKSSTSETTSSDVENMSILNGGHLTVSVKDETESVDTENSENSEGAPPREVGHNLYILAHKLAKFNKELSILVKSKDSEALCYYAAHTAQIEVSNLTLI